MFSFSFKILKSLIVSNSSVKKKDHKGNMGVETWFFIIIDTNLKKPNGIPVNATIQ